jgi:RimK family alpha-L-glutamate ligase
VDVAILTGGLERRGRRQAVGSGGWHAAGLEQALAARGHRAQVLPVDALLAQLGALGPPRMRAGGVVLDELDAVVVRIIPRGSLEQIVFRMDALHRLESLGVLVLNPPAALERTVDKFYTSFLLEDAGLPTPRTLVAESESDARAAFRDLGGDVIVKPLFGANGRGMVRVSDEEIAFRVFRALERERAVFYLQETVPHDGRDLRVFVVGDRVVAAAWRCADGWRTNVARGGRAVAAELPSAWAELGVRAARAVGAGYAGVDLLPARDGRLLVLEVNGIPGWKGVQQATGVDVPAAVVRHLEDLVARGGAR